MDVKVPGVEITKAAHVEAGSTEPIPWNQSRSAPLPAYCRIEGVTNRRTGVGGEEFDITFALAMPDKWNGDFLMQGGGGSNGVVNAPLGLNAAGDNPGLMRGFAVASTDTGHKSHRVGFDFGFMTDQQAYLDFAYLANAAVAALAKQPEKYEKAAGLPFAAAGRTAATGTFLGRSDTSIGTSVPRSTSSGSSFSSKSFAPTPRHHVVRVSRLAVR